MHASTAVRPPYLRKALFIPCCCKRSYTTMSSARMSIRASMSENGARVLPEMFKHKLLQTAEETLEAMQKIWKEAGYEEVECQRLLGEFLNKLKALCSSELDAEQQILEHAQAEVEAKTAEYHDFCEQLGRACNTTHIANLNLTERLAELERLTGLIAGEVSQRQNLLDRELINIENLVDSIGDGNPSENAFDGPAGTPKLSDVRLNLMRRYVAELEGIKAERVKEVKSLASDCHKHMVDLMYAEEGFKTMADSEEYLMLDKAIDKFHRTGDFSLGLYKSDIARLTMRLKSFVEEKERRRIELGQIGADIARLWTLLRIPSTERDLFSSSFKMNLSMETLSKGVDELARLREIRAQSLGKVIASIREDIALLWAEAGIESEETRMAEFPLYFQDVSDVEDSAVDQHEEYFAALRARVEELRPLLQKVSRREAVVQERIDLEHLQMNPERLTARGPNAREERKKEEYMSNRVKNLDKITKELLTHIAAWEETNGPFMYGGDRYADRVVLQDEHYIEIRDGLRNARKKKDGKMEASAMMGVTNNNSSSNGVGAKTMHGMGGTVGAVKRSSVTCVPSSAMKVPHAATATPARHMPPHPPASAARTVAAAASAAHSSAVSRIVEEEDSENIHPDRHSGLSNTSSSSRESDGTNFTSFTQIKERPLSTDSHTVVRVPLV